MMLRKIAIIGAGISGLTLARELSNFADVVIFEKENHVGGRMASFSSNNFSFDYGAQCFTVRTNQFASFLEPFIKSGIIKEWRGKVMNFISPNNQNERIWSEKHFVCSPNMDSLCIELSKNLNIVYNTPVSPIKNRFNRKWELAGSNGETLGLFDVVISTSAPDETCYLLEDNLDINDLLSMHKMQPCISLMLGFDTKWENNWIGGKVHNNPIKWISINSSKPDRNKNHTEIVVHSRSNWAENNYLINDDCILETLLINLKLMTSIDGSKASFAKIHRWSKAIVASTEKTGPFFDDSTNFGGSSDWCYTSRIEEAWLSAIELSQMIIYNYTRRAVV
ncbi:MAG: FAD-dependent oxidoreductase [Rickettsiaceae bacterium]|nr:FAD-dependent oxidoreductase [Rickettsiaceae bacterium]